MTKQPTVKVVIESFKDFITKYTIPGLKAFFPNSGQLISVCIDDSIEGSPLRLARLVMFNLLSRLVPDTSVEHILGIENFL